MAALLHMCVRVLLGEGLLELDMGGGGLGGQRGLGWAATAAAQCGYAGAMRCSG